MVEKSINGNDDSDNCVTSSSKSNSEIKESQYCNRKTWITIDRMNSLRKQAQEAASNNRTFTIRGCFNSIRNALIARGWVEKLDVHRKHAPSGTCQVTYEDLAQSLPKRKCTETRRQYLTKCERNIMSRFLEHVPIDFLWTARKEKCDYIDMVQNPLMIINKIQRIPFTSKEGLCTHLKDFYWFHEDGISELFFPRCYNAWSPEELAEFVDNFKMTACIAFIKWLVDKFAAGGFNVVFSPTGKIPFTAIEFAFKRCNEYVDACNHHDIDSDDSPHIWEHDWDAFLTQQHMLVNLNGRILADPQRLVENVIKTGNVVLENVKKNWPQYCLDGYQNIWIIKPANKCRGRGIQLMDNLKKIMTVVNPSVSSKSRFVVQKYIERPLIIHNTKFDIRQWFLITNVQPLVVWMYKESYIRFSSQEYSLSNHHESIHLTNHAIQKKYTNGKRDKRLPSENMWDCYSFQAYLRQIGKHEMWADRIYPGMRKAIIGTALASQDNIERRHNAFEVFGADFMICENFYPWLIEVNASPDFGATTSVTARMCPQCLEDVVRVVIDRKHNPKTDTGNFELVYRQTIPPSPAYMGLNLFVKGKQLLPKTAFQQQRIRRERAASTVQYRRILQSSVTIQGINTSMTNLKEMPTYNATENMEKTLQTRSSRKSESVLTISPREKSAILLAPKSASPQKSSSLLNLDSFRSSLKSGPSSTIPSPLAPQKHAVLLKLTRQKRMELKKNLDLRPSDAEAFKSNYFNLVTSPTIRATTKRDDIAGLLCKSTVPTKSRKTSAKSSKKYRYLSTQSLVNRKQQAEYINSLKLIDRNPKKRKASLEAPSAEVKSMHAIGKGFLAWKARYGLNRSAPQLMCMKGDRTGKRFSTQTCPNA